MRLISLVSLDDPAAGQVELVGAKAALLARARQAGLPVLPGSVVPVEAGRAVLAIGRAALAARGVAGARGAVLRSTVDPELVAAAAVAAAELGGRVIVRSSSELEADPRWSGALSSITEIEPDAMATALRSCWASAFAPDPVERARRCGIEPGSFGLALLIQPELRMVAGGSARVLGGSGPVTVTGVFGHPGALFAGLVDGRSSLVDGTVVLDGGLAEILDQALIGAVAALARSAAAVGADAIEWAVHDGQVALLQATPPVPAPVASPPSLSTVESLWPFAVSVGGVSCVAGDAIGPLAYVRPHETVADGCILVADRPVPALAPLLFGARGIVCRSGPTDSHLASVARAIGVPMIVEAALDTVTGSLSAINEGPGWLGAIDGRRAELQLVNR